ncbi:c-type cytochrome [Bacteroidetes bacterium endosymbiont of Geopemphigus sp.]|nr:cytochrome c [Bacteroidetes bacterium endosymbiont of Geopemphigus sp.]
MPDIYYSKAYEPYADPVSPYREEDNRVLLFKNGTTSLLPVIGTVARTEDDSLPYTLPDSNEGYEASLKILTSPLDLNQKTENLERGKAIYQMNCAICHGDIGDGQGELVKNEKILGVPNYKDRDITIGSIYYVIMYGRNNMGSYASQLTPADRWKIAEYVMQLKKQ